MYAVMLSRLDDVMVTLMTSELAAGNFGPVTRQGLPRGVQVLASDKSPRVQ